MTNSVLLARGGQLRTVWAAVAGAALASLAAGGPAEAQFYKITNLGVLPGGSLSVGAAICPTGGVAGWATNSTFQQRACWWRDGALFDLGTLGGTASFAYGANGLGQVVGEASTGILDPAGYEISRAFRAEVRDGAVVLTDLGTLGGRFSMARGVNSLGQVVGTAQNAAGAYRAFRTAPGGTIDALADLGTLGGAESVAAAVNDAGQAAGWAQNALYRFRAFRTAPGGKITASGDLGTLGGPQSYALGINATGHVVGQADRSALDSSGNPLFQAFLHDGAMRALGTLGGGRSSAAGINAADHVVGWSDTAAGAFHAFLWRDGVMRDLNKLVEGRTGWELLAANGINDQGCIVGYGAKSGAIRAFLLIPTLEMRVNAGGPEFRDSAGRVWLADTCFKGGAAAAYTARDILDTVNDGMFFRQRTGSAFSYRLPVKPGSYQVTLWFAECQYGVPGARRFDVSLNGSRVLSGFDVFAEAGGKNRALSRTFTTAAGSTLVVSFKSVAGGAAVAAIDVRPL